MVVVLAKITRELVPHNNIVSLLTRGRDHISGTTSLYHLLTLCVYVITTVLLIHKHNTA